MLTNSKMIIKDICHVGHVLAPYQMYIPFEASKLIPKIIINAVDINKRNKIKNTTT